jgi:alpha-galactosidase
MQYLGRIRKTLWISVLTQRFTLFTNIMSIIVKIIIFLLIGVVADVFFMVPTTGVPKENATTFNSMQWVKKNFANGVRPPFSFIYDGKISDDFILQWKYQALQLSSVADRYEYIFTYTDPTSGLMIKCNVIAYKDFPAVEWVLKFINTSTQNTPLIEKVKTIDMEFPAITNHVILHHSRGSDANKNDFEPFDQPIKVGDNVYLSPDGGRSSDGNALPFFNIETPGAGVVVAVGWTGKWFADVARLNDSNFTLAVGMERMQLMLYPGEEIRTPRIALLFWSSNDRMVGHNSFRRFVLAHHSRKIGAKFAEYPLSTTFDHQRPAPCEEFECLTADWAIASIRQKQYFNTLPEVFWLDAGWYAGCGWNKERGRWYQNVGNWFPDKERFPNGLRPIADVAHSVGAKFMVWFEPERVQQETQFAREHPEWLIKRPNDSNRLFDLGNSAVRLWLTDYISDIIRYEGIDYYRQDCNLDPYPFWKEKDTPRRIGMAEIRHVEGLYDYWDSLLTRFPKLLIDNCASGGRRIDLETISRRAPLWRTDYGYGEPNGYQCHTYGLNFYLPIHGTGPINADNYNIRSGLSSAMKISLSGRPIADIQKIIREYKELRPYYYCDYYPLTTTEDYTDNDVWLAYQMDRPEHGDGIILAFHKNKCPLGNIRVRLSGVENDLTYKLYNVDNDIYEIKIGRELKDGIELQIKNAPGSSLIKYHIVTSI